ncbi:MAG: hypothetical protein A2X86_16195 [Bdellovibrionales bacterium GWA2_49_15]|nr:MAG: hypothetical protein A2X86_16195 [Bdellovibrionales bacterium GWA2_49_15]HAZ13647.1 hypothetical protein [Bdellovibrionales bacterium]
MKINCLAWQCCLLMMSSFSLSALAYVNVDNVGDKVIYDFVAEGVTLQTKNLDGQLFKAASLVGLDGYTGINNEIGSPEVPVIRFNVMADDASDIKIITRSFFNEEKIQVLGELKPVVAPVEKIAGARYEIFKNNNFKSMSAYPAGDFEISELGLVRGQKVFQVTLYPAQFISATNQLRISRSYQVEVTKSREAEAAGADGIVFVVGTKFKNSPSLKAYMAKKAATGLTVSQIDAAALNPDQIRAKIKALYSANKSLKYVVIVGDAADVPALQSTTIYGITDHYYASIDTSNYQSDIKTPDLFVGRFSAADEQQLATILLKYTRYMDGDFSSRGWLNHTSFLATDDRWELAEGTHNYVVDTYTKTRGYTGTFPEVEQAGGDKLYAVTYNAGNSEVMEAITKGRSIIDYSGHGANTFWDAPRVEQSDVRSLTQSSLPFVISNACITGDFRVTESFAETWQRQEWGAVMFWGSMDSTYWDEDDILEKRMFDGIFTGGKTTFGAITQFALEEMAKHYGGSGRSDYYFETYHMFGDPSIALRIK